MQIESPDPNTAGNSAKLQADNFHTTERDHLEPDDTVYWAMCYRIADNLGLLCGLENSKMAVEAVMADTKMAVGFEKAHSKMAAEPVTGNLVEFDCQSRNLLLHLNQISVQLDLLNFPP